MQTSSVVPETWSPARLLMPTYEYSCQKCGQTLKAFQSMRDEPFRECPKSLPVAQMGTLEGEAFTWHRRGLIYQGSGFYSTDIAVNHTSSCQKNLPPKASGKAATILKKPSPAKNFFLTARRKR